MQVQAAESRRRFAMTRPFDLCGRAGVSLSSFPECGFRCLTDIRFYLPSRTRSFATHFEAFNLDY